MLLSKGFEIEMYTGTPQGEIVGLSDRIVADLNGFVREPDSRNVEYTTAPLCRYESLLCELVVPRQRLRQYLKKLGNYTLIPGSTLSLGGGDRFYRSDPKNPYHEYIEKTYGTKVVTASIHINMGIADPEVLMRACRLVRLEAPLYLALSASSPFFNGQVTGSHSTRWQVFPQTPEFVPLFESHRHYIDWTQEQLAKGTMQNVRHLWTSVRPNGDRRPYSLNRLELRICDLVTDPIALLAITALLEARLWQAIADPGLDPLLLCDDPQGLVDLTATHEKAVAQSSLEARLTHWQDGRSILAREWIEELYDRVWPFAKQKGFSCFLSPVKKILRQGNESLRWLQEYQRYGNLEQVMQQAIAHTEQEEQEMADHLCHPLVA